MELVRFGPRVLVFRDGVCGFLWFLGFVGRETMHWGLDFVVWGCELDVRLLQELEHQIRVYGGSSLILTCACATNFAWWIGYRLLARMLSLIHRLLLVQHLLYRETGGWPTTDWTLNA